MLATQRHAADALYRSLDADRPAVTEAGIQGLYLIGDAYAPRQQVADAIFDGHRLGREIDTSDPSTPLPYIRERRVIATTDVEYDSMLSPND